MSDHLVPGEDAVTPESVPGRDGDLGTPRRRRRTGMIVSLVVAVFAAGFVAVLATGEPATDRRASSALVGKVAPPLAGDTIDGGHFDLDNHRGDWIVVNFFATWCVPCRQEHPELVAFDEAQSRLGDATLVSVLFSDDTLSATQYFRDNGGDWPVVVDDGARIATAYAVPKVPETYLIAPSGRIVQKLTGGVTRAGLDDLIAQYESLAESAVEEAP